MPHRGNNGLDNDDFSHDHHAKKDHAMRQRLDDVKARINKISPDDEKALQNEASVSTKRQSIGRAMRLGTDLVAGVAIGGLIGFWLDRWFDTKPALFIVFFLLGTAAGFLNVFRTAHEIQKEQNDQVKQGKLDLGQDLHDSDDD